MIEPHDIGDPRCGTRRRIPPHTIDRVVADVAAEYGVPVSEIRGPKWRRTRPASRARREAWRRLANPNVSIAALAADWPCHWTTILHALGRVHRGKPRIPDRP